MKCLFNLIRKKSNPAIAGADFKMGYNRALLVAFDNMPEIFHAAKYLREVRRLSGTLAYDTTILRALRAMRKMPTRNWICINHNKSIYQKIKQC